MRDPEGQNRRYLSLLTVKPRRVVVLVQVTPVLADAHEKLLLRRVQPYGSTACGLPHDENGLTPVLANQGLADAGAVPMIVSPAHRNAAVRPSAKPFPQSRSHQDGR